MGGKCVWMILKKLFAQEFAGNLKGTISTAPLIYPTWLQFHVERCLGWLNVSVVLSLRALSGQGTWVAQKGKISSQDRTSCLPYPWFSLFIQIIWGFLQRKKYMLKLLTTNSIWIDLGWDSGIILFVVYYFNIVVITDDNKCSDLKPCQSVTSLFCRSEMQVQHNLVGWFLWLKF